MDRKDRRRIEYLKAIIANELRKIEVNEARNATSHSIIGKYFLEIKALKGGLDAISKRDLHLP